METKSREQIAEELELELVKWKELRSNPGFQTYLAILKTNIRNFQLTTERPALSLDQMIESNSAVHRIDALKHCASIADSKILDIETDLQECRRLMALGEEHFDEEFRQNYKA